MYAAALGVCTSSIAERHVWRLQKCIAKVIRGSSG